LIIEAMADAEIEHKAMVSEEHGVIGSSG